MEQRRAKVYLETSFISYMVGKDTSNVKIASEQAWTRKWWEEIAPTCDVFVSNFVLDEAQDGNADFVARRLEFLKDITSLDYDGANVRDLAKALLGDEAFPPNAVVDAYHVAVSAVTGMNYLLTWNCKHIANPIRLPKTQAIIRQFGYPCPQILKPSTYFEYMELEG